MNERPVSVVGDDVIAEMCEMAGQVPAGCFVEVGVYKGGTAWHLAEICKEQERACFLYDTFTGMPYQGEFDNHRIGDFGDTDYETVKNALPYAKVIKGVFPESAVEMGGIAFVHLDCDQYQSYRDSIFYLWPRMVQGGVMWFDDYCLPGAKKAIDEIFGDVLQISRCNKQYVRK